jgi:hypothetical protein
MSEFLHECVRGQLRFRLSNDGKLTVKNLSTGREQERPWYSDSKTGKPWTVKRAKSFKGLIVMSDKDGEYDDIRKG